MPESENREVAKSQNRKIDPQSAITLLLSLAVVGGTIIVTWLIDYGHASLPSRPICWSQLLLGADCPGCGLTRSFLALGRGEVATAFVRNPMGPLLFLFLVVQIAVRAVALARPSMRLGRFNLFSIAALLAILLARSVHFYLF